MSRSVDISGKCFLIRSSVLALTALLPLYGCDPASKESTEAACQLDAEKFVAVRYSYAPPDARASYSARMTELCMQSHGYELDDTSCRGALFAAPELARKTPDCYRRDWKLW